MKIISCRTIADLKAALAFYPETMQVQGESFGRLGATPFKNPDKSLAILLEGEGISCQESRPYKGSVLAFVDAKDGHRYFAQDEMGEYWAREEANGRTAAHGFASDRDAFKIAKSSASFFGGQPGTFFVA
ncbi:hypothetical protein OH491_10855 [Termitidicoccus mucosus]|uniref:Uncharacterized protein n=1 Tax=Termitidicoccus mucosus TaxID=1184151 RepID=A0A178IEK0_9BACT|nr:hypothetical protein AW736_16500 [Opitutaceae bacterium TSB47]